MKSSLRVALPLKNQGKDHKLKKARSPDCYETLGWAVNK